MLPNRRSVFSGRCGRLSLSFGSATLGLGRLVRPFHPGLSVWVTVHVFVLSFMFSLGGTFTLRAARLSLAHRILTQPPTKQPSRVHPSDRYGALRPRRTRSADHLESRIDRLV